jgi:hypothetical protein
MPLNLWQTTLQQSRKLYVCPFLGCKLGNKRRITSFVNSIQLPVHQSGSENEHELSSIAVGVISLISIVAWLTTGRKRFTEL